MHGCTADTGDCRVKDSALNKLACVSFKVTLAALDDLTA